MGDAERSRTRPSGGDKATRSTGRRRARAARAGGVASGSQTRMSRPGRARGRVRHAGARPSARARGQAAARSWRLPVRRAVTRGGNSSPGRGGDRPPQAVVEGPASVPCRRWAPHRTSCGHPPRYGRNLPQPRSGRRLLRTARSRAPEGRAGEPFNRASTTVKDRRRDGGEASAQGAGDAGQRGAPGRDRARRQRVGRRKARPADPAGLAARASKPWSGLSRELRRRVASGDEADSPTTAARPP